MPWHIEKGGGTCKLDEYAVIKNADGSTAGCHPNPDAAKRQIAALYANEKPGKKRGLSTALEETRALPADVAGMEIRSAEDESSEDRFHGYAMVWNSRAAIGDPYTVGFYEQCSPGMVTKTLREGDQRFFLDHNPFYIVSRRSAGTLSLTSDDHGLVVDSALDDRLSYVRDFKANVDNRNITGMSFGMKVVKDSWAKERVTRSDGQDLDVEVRTLLEVQLVEVSAVTFPAYGSTQASLKTIATALRQRGDLEAIECRAQWCPELFEMCGIDRDLRRVTIDLGSSQRTINNEFLTALRHEVKKAQDELNRSDEPDTTTRQDQDGQTEPVASTRIDGPSPSDRLRVLSARFHLPIS
jgi:HK97 family phage prohead protease